MEEAEGVRFCDGDRCEVPLEKEIEIQTIKLDEINLGNLKKIYGKVLLEVSKEFIKKYPSIIQCPICHSDFLSISVMDSDSYSLFVNCNDINHPNNFGRIFQIFQFNETIYLLHKLFAKNSTQINYTSQTSPNPLIPSISNPKDYSKMDFVLFIKRLLKEIPNFIQCPICKSNNIQIFSITSVDMTFYCRGKSHPKWNKLFEIKNVFS